MYVWKQACRFIRLRQYKNQVDFLKKVNYTEIYKEQHIVYDIKF